MRDVYLRFKRRSNNLNEVWVAFSIFISEFEKRTFLILYSDLIYPKDPVVNKDRATSRIWEKLTLYSPKYLE